ncbi:MAG: hypothetical protein J1F39_03130 [Clostridiales bacterium]|nr:hypothetical protein [Clostridiales bacterium]
MIHSDGKMDTDMLTAEQSGGVSVRDTSSDSDSTEKQHCRAEDRAAEEGCEAMPEAECGAQKKSESAGERCDDKKSAIRNDAQNQSATEKSEDDGIGDMIGFGIKVAAVALSVVFLLISILSVALPFSAMKVYNQLGMYDRALESGERFINARMREHRGWEISSEIENYGYLYSVGELVGDEEFIEALDVCITLSDKLMRAQLKDKSISGAKYYAEKLERLTHAFISLSAETFTKRNSANIASVPYLQLRPYVYSYRHSIMKLNYSARAVLGTTDMLLYNVGRSDRPLTNIVERLNTFTGTVQKDSTLIDQYVDFIGELNAYLDYELGLLDLSGVSLDETTVRTKYNKILKGTEFSLFINENGFTDTYNRVGRTFTEYAQLAYDYDPTTQTDTMDARLHQLYWLQELGSFAEKMAGMQTLWNYNVYAYPGTVDEKIRDDYPSWEFRKTVYNGQQNQLISELYSILMDRYLSIFKS